MTAVLVQNLSHSYPAKRGEAALAVLSDLNLEVREGEIFGLLGPNGGGKTTLFKILSTSMAARAATQGRAEIFGLDVARQPEQVQRKIGVVFQSPSLDKKLTLFENIIHQGHLYGLSGADLRSRAEKVLSSFSLLDRKNDLVEKLSGGLQRRGEICKGLLHKPELLLMDEPSTGLDPGARLEMWETLFRLKKDGVTILLTTHLMEEGDKCDRLAILNRGRCVAIGTPSELKSRIGGDVINIQTTEAASLTEKVRAKFNVSPVAMDGHVRLEIKDGHKFIPSLVEAFPGMIQAVTIGKPTLEDVFVKETGQRFWEEPS